MIFGDTYLGIDLGCVLASIWHPFGIHVRVYGCSFLICSFYYFFHIGFEILRPQMESINRDVGSGVCGRPPQS